MGNPATKVQLIDTIEKALLLVFKDLRILSNSLSLRVYNFHTARVLDSLMKKLQCAKNERLRLFHCLTPLQRKMPIFLNFKPKLFSKKGRFWENVLDNFQQFLPLKSLHF